MNNLSKRLLTFGLALAAALILIVIAKAVINSACFSVGPNEAVILTKFGRIEGKPVIEPGLHYKTPFVEAVNRIDLRIQKWDGDAVSMPTGDKRFMIVDPFARWRISDPVLYFTRMRDRRTALSRIEDIVGSDIRNAVGEHPLIEIVRTDKTRKPVNDQNGEQSGPQTLERQQSVNELPTIRVGRTAIEHEVLITSAPKLAEVGVELIDVRLLRINYTPGVMEQIKSRMTSERKQIADRYRAEGEGKAAEILGSREEDLKAITSAAYKEAQQIRGEADAKAAEVYARAFNQSATAVELYGFLRTLETYRKSITNGTTLILTTESDIFRAFKSSAEKKP
jgi:modulator of FtsH protease HflC